MLRHRPVLIAIIAIVVLAVLAGAAWLVWSAWMKPEDDTLAFRPTSFRALEGWAADDHAAALAAFRRSCAVWARRDDGATLLSPAAAGAHEVYGRVGDWRAVCAEAARVPQGDGRAARAFFEGLFTPVKVLAGRRDKGLFTGYYEPELKGSRTRHGDYQVPILARPDDLVMVELGQFRPHLAGERIAGRVAAGRLVPYADRAAIEAGALDHDSLAIVWVDDAVDAFFLHIQGSGRVTLDDGAVIRVGYAAQNGHPYTAIGRILIEMGEIAREAMSMQAIRKWLAANPERGRDIMGENASYIFFTEITVDDPALGPPGAQGVALTPGRSLAVDLKHHAMGAPVWVSGTAPVAHRPDTDEPFARLMVAQDTGGAIRGPVRGDVFWGFGADAADIAGRMRHEGTMTVLLPNPVAARLAPGG